MVYGTAENDLECDGPVRNADKLNLVQFMRTINIHAAKTHLSGLVEAAAAGEEIVIAKAGKPMARLVALERPSFGRALGALKGRIHAADDFDAALPPEILKGFGIDR